MIFQNLDLDTNKFFTNKDLSKIFYIEQLKTQALSREIYFRPGACPLINTNDWRDGSCFENYVIPSASYLFNTNGEYKLLDKCISLDHYTDQLYQSIKNRIIQIYQQHNNVTLCYSGGIDSMVLLSFVISQNLLNRTDILCFENHTQTDQSCLHINQDRKQLVNSVIKLIEQQSNSITWSKITSHSIANAFNNYNLEHLKCYATTAALNMTKSGAVISGFHGNQALLHKNMFVDEIILQRPSAVNEVKKLLEGPKNFYTQSLKNYNVDSVKIGIEYRHMLLKPWSLLDGVNQNRLYAPIADNHNLEQLRQLDFGKIPVDAIANATVAKELIERNQCQHLLEYLEYESLKDSDNLENITIPIELLRNDLLTIPTNLTHNLDGENWLKDELARAFKTGDIPINSLVSLKALQWLSAV